MLLREMSAMPSPGSRRLLPSSPHAPNEVLRKGPLPWAVEPLSTWIAPPWMNTDVDCVRAGLMKSGSVAALCGARLSEGNCLAFRAGRSLRLASLAQGARLVGRAEAASEVRGADESSGRGTKGEGYIHSAGDR